MKIEMGESLFVSWLKHVKNCQIVQLNWKKSPKWVSKNNSNLEEIMEETKSALEKKGYNIYKKNNFQKFLVQAEIDVLGISFSEGETKIYAVDVAFHEEGLNYGKGKEKTVENVIKKMIRAFFCINSFFEVNKGEIIFAAPKISKNILDSLNPLVNYFNSLLKDWNYKFELKIISNNDFKSSVLEPLLDDVSVEVSDTSELFMRSYQLIRSVYKINKNKIKKRKGII